MKLFQSAIALLILSTSSIAEASRYNYQDYDSSPASPGSIVFCVAAFIVIALIMKNGSSKSNDTTVDYLTGNMTKKQRDNFKGGRVLDAIRHGYGDYYPKLVDKYEQCFKSKDMKSFQHAITRHFINEHQLHDEEVLLVLIEEACNEYAFRSPSRYEG